jgi:hypothetical protein
MNENIEFWESVEKTDPKYTKSVNAGGRKLTAINAQQQIKNATEKWGMYGKTWGLKDIKLDYINNLCNNQVLAVAQAIFFYPDGVFDIGSSILVQSWIASKSYNKVDDDFLKKLETDMTTKALSKIGFNSDVFLGMYDDNKYIQKITKEFNNNRKPSLTLKGYDYLTTKGTKEQIQTALDDRRMSTEERNELTKLLNKNG